jgi:hypothetical protein
MDTLMGHNIALIFILFFDSYSKYWRSSQLILSTMNCFTGGVFLAMTCILILPEVVKY